MFYVHHSSGWGWGWWVLMTLGMVAFWAFVIYGIVWLARSGRPDETVARPAPEPPEEILKRRLAEGEISVEEYERLAETIRDRPHATVAAAGPEPDG